MNLPIEIINKIFTYLSSPTAQLIKDEYLDYLTTYDKEYDEFYYSFSENYFSKIQDNKIVTIKFKRLLNGRNALYLPDGINWNMNENMDIDGIYFLKKDVLRLYEDLNYIVDFINNLSDDDYDDEFDSDDDDNTDSEYSDYYDNTD